MYLHVSQEDVGVDVCGWAWQQDTGRESAYVDLMGTTRGAVGTVVAMLLLAGCSSAPPSFTTHGTLTLTSTINLDGYADNIAGSAATLANTTGETCSGAGGYDDLIPGAQVKVSDASGKTLALGQLDPGKYDAQLGTCTFTFTVPGTPAEQAFYGVMVSHRGAPQFTYAQMKTGPSLTIGSP